MVAMQSMLMALILPLAPGDAPAHALQPAAFMSDQLHLAKASMPGEWPFTVEEGLLRCTDRQGHRSVFFAELRSLDEIREAGPARLPRYVVVSSNPFALVTTVGDSDLYLPFDTLETLIKRLAPLEATGLKLCDGPGETYDDKDL